MTDKTLQSRTVGAGRWAAVGLLVILFGGLGLAEEEAKSPEPLETELIGIRNAIRNASVKLKNDIIGIQSSGANAPATPAGRCCANNIEKIEKRIATANRILGDFDRCYVDAGREDMVLSGRVARSDLAAFSKTLSAFANAPNKSQARGALQAMTRTYNLLRESAVSLAPCEGMESLILPEENGEQED